MNTSDVVVEVFLPKERFPCMPLAVGARTMQLLLGTTMLVVGHFLVSQEIGIFNEANQVRTAIFRTFVSFVLVHVRAVKLLLICVESFESIPFALTFKFLNIFSTIIVLAPRLKVGKFSKVDKWVEGLPKDQARLAFGICERKHWVVILMDLEAKIILYYDPSRDARPNLARRTDTLEVSFLSLQHCFFVLTLLDLVR